jgi:hypothetical protein
MFETDVLGVEEGSEAHVIWRSDIECNFVVELTDSDLVELLRREANVLEVGWAVYLCDDCKLVFTACDKAQWYAPALFK